MSTINASAGLKLTRARLPTATDPTRLDDILLAIGKKNPPKDSFWATSKVLAELKKHSSNEQKQLRKMPEISSYGVGQAR